MSIHLAQFTENIVFIEKQTSTFRLMPVVRLCNADFMCFQKHFLIRTRQMAPGSFYDSSISVLYFFCASICFWASLPACTSAFVHGTILHITMYRASS